ncbi:hypothetical protein AGDE_16925 [Angomonas deanei]|nr:hypothetical protein AGDE_16925 [Angomonas deanei]|eukprot:EPY15894.1 hypothetical protein AGDE_16925 [Angomonas deanei]
MSHKNVLQPSPVVDRPETVPVAEDGVVYTYGEVAEGTAVRETVLPNGRVAYVPVSTAAPYGHGHYGEGTAQDPPATTPPPTYTADLPKVLNYYNTGRPSSRCLLSSRAVVLTLNCLAFIFSVLSIAVPFAKGTVERPCFTMYSMYCFDVSPAVPLYRSGVFFAFSNWSPDLALAGAIVMASGFGVYIPTLILSAIFLHIGRKYPERERQDAADEALPLADRRRRALVRIYYDVNITKALFATTLLAVVFGAITTGLYFAALTSDVIDAKVVVGPVMALIATVLYLAALIMTPIRDATNTSLEFPEEGSSITGGEGCCYFMFGEGCCCEC